MAITFGGDTISTDGSSLQKNINRTIDANGVASGGNNVESFDSTLTSFSPNRPWGHRNRQSPRQNDTNYWDYVDVSNGNGKRGANFTTPGNWIDDATGRFTAPISGVYWFGSHGIAHGGINDGRAAMYVNGSACSRTIAGTQGGNHGGQYGHAMALFLAEGDYVNYAQYSGTGGHQGNWSGFGGVYLG